MNAVPEPHTFDGRPELRDFIHENCGFVRLYSENAQNFCELADDIGLDYAVRKMIAHLRAIADTAKGLLLERERLLGLSKIEESAE